MSDTIILSIIKCDDKKQLDQAFCNFLEENENKFTFPELYPVLKDLWNALFKHLENKHHSLQSLQAIRILSRDPDQLDKIIFEEHIDKLLIKSALKDCPKKLLPSLNDEINNEELIEALKCLCNLVFHSKVTQSICEQNEVGEKIFERFLTYTKSEVPRKIQGYDMKILFLITAHCPKVGAKLYNCTKTRVSNLVDYLVYLYMTHQPSDNKSERIRHYLLQDDEMHLVCDIMLVTFNLMMHNKSHIDLEENHSVTLTSILHDYLLVKASTTANQMVLHSNIINVLTMLPKSCMKHLIIELPKNIESNDETHYEGYDLEAISLLLTFMDKKFENNMDEVQHQKAVLPLLHLLLKLSKSSRIIRKYIRRHILPPLKDVHNRPEQGDTLRNKLCRLLTTPFTPVKDVTAHLLFVLCKENMSRMIKYTGYGNAAGLFAQLGLLGKYWDKKSRDKSNPDEASKYSSDSEDSDTEEYKEYKHSINPIVGCYEPPQPDPTAGMSEEQKEHEAMKLVELIDDLTKKGVIQPCRIGDDGKPEPITHVLQLQEELHKKKES